MHTVQQGLSSTLLHLDMMSIHFGEGSPKYQLGEVPKSSTRVTACYAYHGLVYSVIK